MRDKGELSAMHTLDLQAWPRRPHFEFFRHYTYPHFSLCANVDLTAFYPAVKARGASMNVALVYLIARAANAVPEFRLRIRGDEVVEHDVVHSATTILAGDDLFSFCAFTYCDEFSAFAEHAAEQIARVQQHLVMEKPPGDDLLYMTAIPWVTFTSFLHPLHLEPADSVPRFAWGKFFQEGDRLKMPLNVQGHHALMDGIHMGRFYAHVEADLREPARLLGARP
jgi:chloramphenicol O-acetyltransferase type A